MAEYIDRKELLENLNKFAPEHYSALVNTLIEKQPAVDVVSIGVLEQVRWERDVAIEQLAEYGVCFGEKKKDLVEVVKCKYCKNGKEEKPYIKKDIWCYVHGKDFFADEFCNKGERRTDNA